MNDAVCARLRRVKGPALFSAAALALIWGVLPGLPAGWGMRFGTPYLTFFTLAALGSAAFFALLNWGPIRAPATAGATFASILFVYVATVGGMVAFGYWYYPQFETPVAAAAKPAAEPAGENAAQRRGRTAFLSPQLACFACHTIESLGIRGGQRGPDLSSAGAQAAGRRPGVPAREHLRAELLDPWACFTPLPASGLEQCQKSADAAKTYPQLMPPYKGRLSDAELDDLVAFLMSLTGGHGRHGRDN